MIDTLAQRIGVKWFDYQREAFDLASTLDAQRMLLFYKTGAGKSLTGLIIMQLWGFKDVLVITPPSTFKQWEAVGAKLGMSISCISHAKFRMKDTRLSRKMPLIVDEFHLLGGHKGQGWKKLDTLARGLQAPLIAMSATPNYNDAERVYCIQHVLAPDTCRGGFIEFLYRHCETEQNPFGREPIVTGFTNYSSAAEYLAALPYVSYLEDDLVYTIEDVEVEQLAPEELTEWGYNRRRHKMVASLIEEKHALIHQGFVDELGLIRVHVCETLLDLMKGATTPVLVFANHSTVADALERSLDMLGLKCTKVTGDTSAKQKDLRIAAFKAGEYDVLVGTASLATGTDGMDKMCDYLVILDDTDDDSLRRQLVGRIMPRGLDTDATGKHVWRMVLQ